MPTLTRLLAAITALSAWLGLGLQFYDSMQRLHNPLAAVWVLAIYFTVITNFIVALAFTATMLERHLHPRLLGGVVLAMTLVGGVYHLLLRNVPIIGGPAAHYANFFFHTTTPILVVLFWVACTPKGRLHWIDAAWWPLYPLAYLVYALIRGSYTHIYPYFFIDVSKIGMADSLRNAAGITFAFVVVSLVLIAIDRTGKSRT